MNAISGFQNRRPCVSLLAGVLFFLSILPVSSVFAATEIFNVRHWAAPDHTRIVFDATEEPSYTVEREEGKVRITIREAGLSETLPGTIPVGKPGIREILLNSEEDRVILELALSEHIGVNIFSLSRIQDKPHRLVVDILLPEAEKKDLKEPESAEKPLKKRVVVLDPGHGGEDPGAIGRGGTQEKDIVLRIGRATRDALNKKRGYRAILTRDGDYYVPFRKRMKIARDNNADLFVSIHADASRSRRVNGSSVYTLSLRGASSEAARLLAKNENLSDVIGGSPLGESTDESDPIILNMFQTNSINRSKSYGEILLQHLDDVGNVKFRRIQEAPFLVLKLPEIPSVLVEVAFVSNPSEEKLLRSRRHQRKLAEALASSIEEFLPLEGSPPHLETAAADHPSEIPGTEATRAAVAADGSPGMSAWAGEEGSMRKNERPEQRDDRGTKPSATKLPSGAEGESFHIHVVKKGEFLEKIALRYGVTVGQIAAWNRLDPARPLYVKRKLKILFSGERSDRSEAGAIARSRMKSKATTPKTPTYQRHKVRKGESLSSIAKRYKVTVKELRALNGMKRSDVLKAHQNIKVPSSGSDRF